MRTARPGGKATQQPSSAPLPPLSPRSIPFWMSIFGGIGICFVVGCGASGSRACPTARLPTYSSLCLRPTTGGARSGLPPIAIAAASAAAPAIAACAADGAPTATPAAAAAGGASVGVSHLLRRFRAAGGLPLGSLRGGE
eukprot:scaffold1572_cov97-Isochrysis_galbana.AAC.1